MAQSKESIAWNARRPGLALPIDSNSLGDAVSSFPHLTAPRHKLVMLAFIPIVGETPLLPAYLDEQVALSEHVTEHDPQPPPSAASVPQSGPQPTATASANSRKRTLVS